METLSYSVLLMGWIGLNRGENSIAEEGSLLTYEQVADHLGGTPFNCGPSDCCAYGL